MPERRARVKKSDYHSKYMPKPLPASAKGALPIGHSWKPYIDPVHSLPLAERKKMEFIEATLGVAAASRLVKKHKSIALFLSSNDLGAIKSAMVGDVLAKMKPPTRLKLIQLVGVDGLLALVKKHKGLSGFLEAWEDAKVDTGGENKKLGLIVRILKSGPAGSDSAFKSYLRK